MKMNLFLAALCVIPALSMTASPASANEVVNGIFHHAEQIGSVEMNGGTAHWKVTRPDNGATMYFEKCWADHGGYSCLHERIPADNNGGQTADNGGSDLSSQWPDQDHQWFGRFESATKDGNTWFATVTVDGKKQVDRYQGDCKHNNNGWWCY